MKALFLSLFLSFFFPFAFGATKNAMAKDLDNVTMLKTYIKNEYTKIYPEINIDSISIIARSALDIYNIKILSKNLNGGRSQSGYITISYIYNNKAMQENIKYVLQATIALYIANESINAKSNIDINKISRKIQDFSLLSGIPATKSEILESSAKTYMPTNSVIYKNKLSRRFVVLKDSNVKIILKDGGIEASCVGKALENGTKGDIIKVENLESKRIISARALQEGVVMVNN